MNELHNDENLSTADIATNSRDAQTDDHLNRRQAFNEATDRNINDAANASDNLPPNADMQNFPSSAAGREERDSAAARTPSPSNSSPSSATDITGAPNVNNSPIALFPDDELHNFRARWDQVQTSFVDEPRAAVEQADSLVANVVKRIAEQFASEREGLEKQWDRGDNVNTEDLRVALKRYRAFFDRLLAF